MLQPPPVPTTLAEMGHDTEMPDPLPKPQATPLCEPQAQPTTKEREEADKEKEQETAETSRREPSPE